MKHVGWALFCVNLQILCRRSRKSPQGVRVAPRMGQQWRPHCIVSPCWDGIAAARAQTNQSMVHSRMHRPMLELATSSKPRRRADCIKDFQPVMRHAGDTVAAHMVELRSHPANLLVWWCVQRVTSQHAVASETQQYPPSPAGMHLVTTTTRSQCVACASLSVRRHLLFGVVRILRFFQPDLNWAALRAVDHGAPQNSETRGNATPSIT